MCDVIGKYQDSKDTKLSTISNQSIKISCLNQLCKTNNKTFSSLFFALCITNLFIILLENQEEFFFTYLGTVYSSTIYFALIYVWAINHIRHRILKWKSILIDELLRLKFSRVLNFLLYINKKIYIKGGHQNLWLD